MTLNKVKWAEVSGIDPRWMTGLLLLAFTFWPLVADNSTTAPGHPLRIVLVGDSTVTDSAGWGLGFKQYINDQAECVNAAAGGRSSMSYIKEGRWEKALALKGDYYLIQFGHNDEPGKPGCSTDPNTDYRAYMSRYVDETRAIGAKPILVTSLVRRAFDKNDPHKINSSLQPYVDAVKQIAEEKHVPLVDLHARSKNLCESLGQEKCLRICPTKVVDGKTTYDTTHLNASGGVMMARLVVEELRQAAPELAMCLRAEPGPVAAPKEFNVCQYGAVGDGKALDTKAIQKALDVCGQAGGGIVQVPAGTYLSQPLFLHGNINLHLAAGAMLQATNLSADFESPEKPGSTLGLVNAIGCTSVAITGPGTIEGSVSSMPGSGPRLVVLSGCVQDVQVAGITLQNSMSVQLTLTDCEGAKIDDVTLRAPQKVPGASAIELNNSRHLTVTKCTIDVGGGNIVIRADHLDPAHPNGAAEDVTISDCTFRHGHGVRIGSQIMGGVKDITVTDCTFDGTSNGICVESTPGSGGLVQKLVYRNLTMTNVGCPIYLASNDSSTPAESATPPVSATMPVYQNIRIVNLTATGARVAGEITSLLPSAMTNIVLDHVQIAALKGMTIRNAKDIKFNNCRIQDEKGFSLMTENVDGENSHP